MFDTSVPMSFWHPFRVRCAGERLPEVSTAFRPPATVCQPFGLLADRSEILLCPVAEPQSKNFGFVSGVVSFEETLGSKPKVWQTVAGG